MTIYVFILQVKSIIKSVTAENLEESTEQLTTYIVSLTNLEETINFMMKMVYLFAIDKLTIYIFIIFQANTIG